jgi:uncharacterized RDD family membrane protein YckC
MSRSFSGPPDPEDDKQAEQVSESMPPAEETAPLSRRLNFSSINKYRDDEHLAVEPVQVGIGKRLVAGVIDVMAGYLLQLVVNCIPLINVYIHDQLPLVGFLIVRDALFNGRGVGKNLMGLQVVDIKTGQPASFLQSIKRNMVVFGPYVALYLVNLLVAIVPNEMVTSVVTNVVTGAGSVYTLAVIPYEVWRVYSRADGLRWGDQFAGTATIPADMDFSNPLSK